MTVHMPPVPPSMDPARDVLARRSFRLNVATLAYNSLEGVVAITAGLIAGSVALVGFGLDSVIELAASVTALWRLRADFDPDRREHAERAAIRVIGALFVALAAYVTVDAGKALLRREPPSEDVAAPRPCETFEMTIDKDNAALDGFNRWTINAVAYPITAAVPKPKARLA